MTMFENENPIMPMADDGGSGNVSGDYRMLNGIQNVNQRNYGDKYCLASCYLVISNYYGFQLTMQDLIDDGIINSDGSVARWGDYLTHTKTTYSVDAVKSEIRSGKPVILRADSPAPYYYHYAVAYGYDGNKIKIMDPWGGIKNWLGDTQLEDRKSVV